jgi:serine/threonine-protein kinase RsbW
MEFIRRGAREASLSDDRIGELELVIDELVTNVCSHAYPKEQPGEVIVSYSVPLPGELNVEVADRGPAFNPLDAEPPDLNLRLEERPVGGLGISLVKALASRLSYRREQGWNRLTFCVSEGS